jgi:phage protein D/phage baseplate assembly protein gpV
MSALASLPKLAVDLGGSPLAPEEARALGEVRVQQRLSLPTLCELTFVDPDPRFAERASSLPGMSLHLAIERTTPVVFDGQVTAAELQHGPAGGTLVRLRAYDLLHRLRKRQPVRRHTRVTLKDLASELTADLGIEIEAAESGPEWDTLMQFRQSDLDLMIEVAERAGLYFTLRDETLHLLTLEGIGAALPLAMGRTLLEARVQVSGEPACRSVEALGWDPWLAEARRGAAGGTRVGRRVAAEAPPERLGAKGARTLADVTVQSDSQASALAQAELDRRTAGEVALWGMAEGDPRLRPGTPIDVQGLTRALDGRYVLTSVNHTVDRERGFLSEIETAAPQPRVRSRAAVSTIGMVTRVDDPERLGRVRVSLPGYQDVESDWLEVLTPGAGDKKGLVSLPDVGDRVLLLVGAEDPGQAVVLGGLYGKQGPPDAGVEGGAVKRYTFTTPGGQRIQLDDDKGRVRVDNSGGHRLELSPGRARLLASSGSYVELAGGTVRIHAAADLEIEAPGRAVTIRGQSIDFQRG